MGIVIETLIDRFDGGMTNAVRDSIASIQGNTIIAKPYARIISHFDVFSAKGQMIPHLSHVEDDINSNLSTTIAAIKLCQFLSYGTSQSATTQYALGILKATTDARIYSRDSIPTGQWSGLASASVVASEKLFVEYKGGIYVAVGGTAIAKYSISGDSWSAADLSITYTNIGQGLVHSKDDILYIPYTTSAGAFIAKKNVSTWTAAALTLPSNCIPTSISEYGNYLAIATKPLSRGGKSVVYLWDRDSSLSTLSEKIEWGTEDLELIEELEGFLVGISVTGASSIIVSPKIIFKYYAGVGAKQFLEIPTQNSVTLFAPNKQKMNNRIYFMMNAEQSGARLAGIFSIGRNAEGGFGLLMDRLWDNTTVFTNVDYPKGFQLLGDYMTIAYTIGAETATYNLQRTKDNSTYAANSTYESLIFNSGDSSLTKKLIGITIMFEPFSGIGPVVLKYKVDADTSWTQIFSSSTTNSTSHGAINIESTGVTLPTYKEIRFQILSTAATAITGLKFKSEIIDSALF